MVGPRKRVTQYVVGMYGPPLTHNHRMIVDAGRLERAARLVIVRIGYRQYEILSERGANYVDMTESDPCHCEDMVLRSVARGSIKEMPCKHILAALIFEKNPHVMRELDKLNHPEEVE